MRHAVRLFGIIWMIAIALAGIVLVGSGRVRGNRAMIYLLFCAALPGILAYRWGTLSRKTGE